MRGNKRLASVVATALAATALSMGAADADAATPPAQLCGWHPANDSNEWGWVLEAPLNVRTGPLIECGGIGTINSSGSAVSPNLTLHCFTDSGEGGWYYADTPVGTGWVAADDVETWVDTAGC